VCASDLEWAESCASLYAEALHDFLSNVIFEAQEVVALQVEAPSPARSAVINQLYRDAHDSAHSLVSAGQHGVNLKLARCLRGIVGRFGVLQNGVGGTDGEILQRSQAADYGVGNSDAPGFAVGLSGEITERQHR